MYRSYTNFSGGLTTNEGQYAGPVISDMGQTEALAFWQELTNWDGREDGLVKDYGDVATLSGALSGNPIMTLDYNFNGTRIVAAGANVYTVSGSSTTQIYTGVTPGAFFTTFEYDNGSGTLLLLLMNGTDKPLQYDGTTCSQVVYNDPNSIWNDFRPQGACAWRGSVMYWGDPVKKYRICKPRPGTHNNFDNTLSTCDAFDVDAGAGGSITGLKPFSNNFLVIYKKKVIRRLAGSSPFGSSVDEFTITPVTDDFGCIAPRTIVGTDIKHFFLSEDGFRRLDQSLNFGDVDAGNLTYKIQDTMNGLNWTDSVIKNACAVFDKANQKIWLSVPNGASTSNNKIITFRLATSAIHFRGDSEINAACFGYMNRQVTHGDYAGQCYTHGSANNYNGTIITASATSKLIAHIGIGTRKIYREVILYADADGDGDVIVQWQILKRGALKSSTSTEHINVGSNSWDSGQWDQALWATGSQNVFKLNNLGRGNAIAFRFQNVSASQRPKIRQVDMRFDVLGTALG